MRASIFLLCLLLGMSAFADDVDIQGRWRYEDSEVEIFQQNDNKVTATFAKVGAAHPGFEAGDTCFTGTLKGEKLTGKQSMRHPKGQDPHPTDIELKLEGTILKGSRDRVFYHPETKEWTQSQRKVNISLARLPIDVENPKYAAGTTVIHQVRGGSFQYIDLNRPVEVVFQVKEDLGTYKRWKIQDPDMDYINIARITPLRGADPGIQLKMKLGKDAWKDGEKQLLITARLKDGDRELPFVCGKFTVVHLKTVIIAVDGLGHHSIISILKSEQESNFRRVFEDAVNRDTPALSALPSITYTNWPGIFGGLAPKDHGILGNSFFEREKAKAEPFASDGSFDISDNVPVVGGELNERVRIRASLYDDVAAEVRRNIKVWSVHALYAPGPSEGSLGLYPAKGRVDMEAEYYTGILPGPVDYGEYGGHSKSVARNLDTASGDKAKEILEEHIEDIDILTVFFPGPDNFAHAIGKEESVKESDPDKPLGSIAQQIRDVTDGELGKIVREIEDRGYLNATLFVLVSDHGLRAYRNDRLHNIYLPEQKNVDVYLQPEQRRQERAGLENFFESMGLRVWTGWNIDNKTLVYSPNGGMAHIYIRNTQEEKNGKLVAPWSKTARKKDIEMVARQLYVESTGRKYDPPLTKLKGALGNPPAIFVRVGKKDTVNHFTQKFRWLKKFETGMREPEYGTIEDFIKARPGDNWPEFAERMEEMNDTNRNGSRTGDIIIFTDVLSGYLTVNKGEEEYGWHGGATIAESHVALMFNFPGSAVDNQFKKNLIQRAVQKAARGRSSRTLRNWDLRQILVDIYKNLHKNP